MFPLLAVGLLFLVLPQFQLRALLPPSSRHLPPQVLLDPYWVRMTAQTS